MKCLVVKAHPLAESLCSLLAGGAARQLTARGHRVEIEDLYAQKFEPSLMPSERRSYYAGPYAADLIRPQLERLQAADAVVLVFPTWWFGFPAILKGWFDRVWAPGFAYRHAEDFGPIKPGLTTLRHMLAVTTLGSPWWVDRFVFRQPVRRILKRAIVGTCAPRCRFEMLSLYASENLSAQQVERFGARVDRALGRWPV